MLMNEASSATMMTIRTHLCQLRRIPFSYRYIGTYDVCNQREVEGG